MGILGLFYFLALICVFLSLHWKLRFASVFSTLALFIVFFFVFF